jgi:glycosyltransferase involved in cell wall biosynthesis
MKNVMSFMINADTDVDMFNRHVKAQSEISSCFGWRPILYCNKNLDIDGIDVKVMEEVPSPVCKIIALQKEMNGESDDGLIWLHDLDAWQNAPFGNGPEFADAAGYVYSNGKINGGSMFFRKSASDLIDMMVESIPDEPGRTIEERLMRTLRRKFPDRVTLLNSTWNVGINRFEEREREAEKPAKVLHFHPTSDGLLEKFAPLASSELRAVLESNFDKEFRDRYLVKGFFGNSRYINLNYRGDRRLQAAEEFNRIGISPVRFAGIPVRKGSKDIRTRGCTESHLSILREFKKSGEKMIVVLEDDVIFHPDFVSLLPSVVDELEKHEWGLFFFYSTDELGNVAPSLDLDRKKSLVYPLRNVPIDRVKNYRYVQTHAYAIRKNVVDIAIEILERAVIPYNGKKTMSVDRAFGARYEDMKTMASSNDLAIQRNSFSDIRQRFTGQVLPRGWNQLPQKSPRPQRGPVKIGVFCKLSSKGGSEFRCAEIAEMLTALGLDVVLLAHGGISSEVRKKVIRSEIRENAMDNMDDIDVVLVVVSMSGHFVKPYYWEERMINLFRFRRMIFLFNYSTRVAERMREVKNRTDVRAIFAGSEMATSCQEFLEENDIPWSVLPSPICPSVARDKTDSHLIRIGRHSRDSSRKFSDENLELITEVNKRYGDKVLWDFMGVPPSAKENLLKHDNVTVRDEFSMPVPNFLSGIDIFMFFHQWGQTEAWSRCIAEGMVAGCPVLAPNEGGNIDQVDHGKNGFLCNSKEDFLEYIGKLITERGLIRSMGEESIRKSRDFLSPNVANEYASFITEGIVSERPFAAPKNGKTTVKVQFRGPRLNNDGSPRKKCGYDFQMHFSYVLEHYDFQSDADPEFIIHMPKNRPAAKKLLRKFRHPEDGKIHIFYSAGECVGGNLPFNSQFDYVFSLTPEIPTRQDYFRLPYAMLRMRANGFDAHDLIKSEGYEDKIMSENRKFCCLVTKNISGPGTSKRIEMFDILSGYKRVDSGGRRMNNVGRIGPSVVDKINFMRNYKFAIAFENCAEEGYTTEKLPEAMLAGCIPIYYGNPLIHREFNPKSFVVSPDSKLDELRDRVIEIDQNDELYAEYLREPFFPENKVIEEFDKDHMMRGWHQAFSNRVM